MSLRVIGIVGGVASGKSVVTARLQQLGAQVLDADAAGHAVLRQPDVIEALKRRWGDKILTSDGQVSRPAVANIVFKSGNEAERHFLDALTHPRIGMQLDEQLAGHGSTESNRIAVLDAALLLEAGWANRCDEIWFVDAPAESRRKRAEDRGWSVGEWQAREAAQWSITQKRAAASCVIDNSRTLAHTYAQVDTAYRNAQTQLLR